MIETGLITACRKNDRKAQFKLYEQCFQILMRICYRYVRNEEDAAALVNQGFMKVLTNLDKFKEGTSFEAWIKRIMVNTIINEHNKNKKRNEMMVVSDFQEEPNTSGVSENLYETEVAVEEVMNELETLPPTTKLVFNLYAFDGYNHKEIGEMLGISDGTSKWHVSNARKMLQVRFGKKNLQMVV